MKHAETTCEFSGFFKLHTTTATICTVGFTIVADRLHLLKQLQILFERGMLRALSAALPGVSAAALTALWNAD